MTLEVAARAAAETVRARPRGTRWFLACDADADGLCAAAVTAMALRRAGHRFHVRASRDKTTDHYEAVLQEDSDGFFFLDKATSHLATLSAGAAGRPVLVLDHHNLPDDRPADIVLVNPRAEGMDGSRDASSATVAAAFALALDPANLDLAPVGLSGAIGDWQHAGGWRDWNQELVTRCLAAGHIREEPLPNLIGIHLAEALARHEPPIEGLAGDEDACRRFLTDLDIPPEGEPEDLDRNARTRLVSALTRRLLAQGAEEADLDDLVRPALWNVRLDTSLRQVFRIADACGRLGHAGDGIAYLMGDASATEDARRHFDTYKRHLGAAIRHLAEAGTDRRRACQVAWTDAAAYTGMVAGIGMTHVVRDTTVPIVLLARRSDGRIQVSTRGLHAQVEAGMDLGAAASAAAQAVGTEGGGHPIASGAVVPVKDLDAFLDHLDQNLLDQGWLPTA